MSSAQTTLPNANRQRLSVLPSGARHIAALHSPSFAAECRSSLSALVFKRLASNARLLGLQLKKTWRSLSAVEYSNYKSAHASERTRKESASRSRTCSPLRRTKRAAWLASDGDIAWRDVKSFLGCISKHGGRLAALHKFQSLSGPLGQQTEFAFCIRRQRGSSFSIALGERRHAISTIQVDATNFGL